MSEVFRLSIIIIIVVVVAAGLQDHATCRWGSVVHNISVRTCERSCRLLPRALFSQDTFAAHKIISVHMHQCHQWASNCFPKYSGGPKGVLTDSNISNYNKTWFKFFLNALCYIERPLGLVRLRENCFPCNFPSPLAWLNIFSFPLYKNISLYGNGCVCTPLLL
jgi:hypothetical protein